MWKMCIYVLYLMYHKPNLKKKPNKDFEVFNKALYKDLINWLIISSIYINNVDSSVNIFYVITLIQFKYYADFSQLNFKIFDSSFSHG